MNSYSIIINTLNRGPLLQKTLDSLRWLKYEGDFEVIVVNGPSTDNSDEVIQAWLPQIRTANCAVANLSVSRNIGICMARGDIVVFIDDDAIPEPEWLSQLEWAYDSASVGGVGGCVFDQTGYTYQYEYSTATRLGNPNWAAHGTTEHLCFPGSFEFPYLQGTNASFRRLVLLEIGGFDEEIEYYLDETEVCCRIIDAGYIVRQVPGAYVHHKFAPSQVRDEQKVVRNRYPVLKNKIYFSLKHGREYASLQEIEADNEAFSTFHRKDVEFHITGGRLDDSALTIFAEENRKAWEVGVPRGLAEHRELITPEKINAYQGDFLPFSPIRSSQSSAVVLISRDFPPGHSGGVATFSRDLAEALAATGDIIHIITQSADINRVDFEQGVWIHRMVITEPEYSATAAEHRVPKDIWNWSATAFKEAKRISTHRQIRLVEAPVWDCEGVAFLVAKRWPLVTSLQTTLHFFLESHPQLKGDREWMDSFGTPMLALEKEVMLGADAVRSISSAIREDIEQAYGFTLADEKVVVAPLGMPPTDASVSKTRAQEGVTVLFVGRLEYRKGIDVLLAAIPHILEQNPTIRFRILGDDTLAAASGTGTYKEQYLATPLATRWSGQVSFEGRVSDEVLAAAYKACDIFVAPSRFESFGLVFLEAMREAKPVIGGETGGIPEIIANNVNGLLVSPGDVNPLVSAVLRLAGSAQERDAMGKAGGERFLSTFTARAMADSSLPLYELAVANFTKSTP